MGRLRRSSRAIEQAEARHNGLKSKEERYDLGNGITATAYEQKITSARDLLTNYNQTLALADDLLNQFLAAEAELKEYSSRFLSAAKAKYGPNSTEYELAGGTRTEERKSRQTTKPKP
jgi:hypothetical protein